MPNFPLKIFFLLLLIVSLVLGGGSLLSDLGNSNPVLPGAYNRNQNGIWMTHAWLGDDGWFQHNRKTATIPDFRNPDRINELGDLLRRHAITDLFPHLAPTDISGRLPALDDAQARLFLEIMADFRIMPWIGGVLGKQAFPEDAAWRHNFIRSIADLLHNYPQFAGVHINIEPWPSGDPILLGLLEDIRTVLPEGALLSVAAFPPPTLLHSFSSVHWNGPYYRKIAARTDQLVAMMYDTSLPSGWLYQRLMASWTKRILAWAGETPVLLGLPVYDDAHTGYHDPKVENLTNGLRGIGLGLGSLKKIPKHYQGVALYSEWEMDDQEWQLLREHYLNGHANH